MKKLIFIPLLAALVFGNNIGSYQPDIGAHTANREAAPVEYCTDSIKWVDTTKTWADAIAAHVSVWMPNGGKMFFHYGVDSTATTVDSIRVSPSQDSVIYTDTTGPLTASTRYWISFFDSCSRGPGYTGYYTQDSTVDIAEWLYGEPLSRHVTQSPWQAFKDAFVAPFKKAFR